MMVDSNHGVSTSLKTQSMNDDEDLWWKQVLQKWPLESLSFPQEKFEFFIHSQVTQLEARVEKFCEENNLKKVRLSMANPVLPLPEMVEQFQGFLEKISELRTLIKKGYRGVELNGASIYSNDSLHGVKQDGEFGNGDDKWTSSRLPQCDEKLNKMFTFLMTHSLILEQQPPKLVQCGSKYTTSVRFLTTPPSSSDGFCPKKLTARQQNESKFVVPAVKMEILPMRKVWASMYGNLKRLQRTNKSSVNSNLEVTQLQRNPDHDDPMIVKFSGKSIQNLIHCQKIDLHDSHDQEELEGKGEAGIGQYFIKFFYHININGELQEISCFSRPFCCYTNFTPKIEAEETLFWSMCFIHQESEIPFITLDRVRWSQFRTALTTHFSQELGPKVTRQLSDDQVAQLTKIFVQSDKQNEEMEVGDLDHRENDDPKTMMMVERSNLFEKTRTDPQGIKFSYWEWFQGIIKLIQGSEEIQKLWNAGYIQSFIDRHQADEMLVARQQSTGTFLIRFSHSQVGKIVTSFVDKGVHGDCSVWHAAFSKNDLQIVSLGERIRNESRLTKLLCRLNQSNKNEDDHCVMVDKFEIFPAQPSDQIYQKRIELGSSKRRQYASTQIFQILQFPSQ